MDSMKQRGPWVGARGPERDTGVQNTGTEASLDLCPAGAPSSCILDPL